MAPIGAVFIGAEARRDQPRHPGGHRLVHQAPVVQPGLEVVRGRFDQQRWLEALGLHGQYRVAGKVIDQGHRVRPGRPHIDVPAMGIAVFEPRQKPPGILYTDRSKLHFVAYHVEHTNLDMAATKRPYL